MIQRIQSIFLFLATCSFGGEFLVPFATSDQSATGLFEDLQYNIMDHPALITLTVLGAFLSLAAIFLFNNRPTQLKLSYASATIAILLPIISVLLYSNQTAGLQSLTINDSLGLYLPIGMLVFSLLAARYINKDQKLVKSMDRLR